MACRDRAGVDLERRIAAPAADVGVAGVGLRKQCVRDEHRLRARPVATIQTEALDAFGACVRADGQGCTVDAQAQVVPSIAAIYRVRRAVVADRDVVVAAQCADDIGPGQRVDLVIARGTGQSVAACAARDVAQRQRRRGHGFPDGQIGRPVAYTAVVLRIYRDRFDPEELVHPEPRAVRRRRGSKICDAPLPGRGVGLQLEQCRGTTAQRPARHCVANQAQAYKTGLTKAVLRDIDASTAVQEVVTAVATQVVVASATSQTVVAGGAIEVDAVATSHSAGIEGVAPAAVGRDVGVGGGGRGIQCIEDDDRLGALAAGKIQCRSGQRLDIVMFDALDVFIGPEPQRRAVDTQAQVVPARAAVYRVGCAVVADREVVVATQRADDIRSCQRVDLVAVGAAGQRVVARTASDVAQREHRRGHGSPDGQIGHPVAHTLVVLRIHRDRFDPDELVHPKGRAVRRRRGSKIRDAPLPGRGIGLQLEQCRCTTAQRPARRCIANQAQAYKRGLTEAVLRDIDASTAVQSVVTAVATQVIVASTAGEAVVAGGAIEVDAVATRHSAGVERVAPAAVGRDVGVGGGGRGIQCIEDDDRLGALAAGKIQCRSGQRLDIVMFDALDVFIGPEPQRRAVDTKAQPIPTRPAIDGVGRAVVADREVVVATQRADQVGASLSVDLVVTVGAQQLVVAARACHRAHAGIDGRADGAATAPQSSIMTP